MLENNPVKYSDQDGNDIKEITLYNASVGLIVAGRFSAGVAIDSDGDMDVFMKFEIGVDAEGDKDAKLHLLLEQRL